MTCAVGIDQGTSGTTVIVVDLHLGIRNRVSVPIESKQGKDGAVEQDPWTVLQSIVEAIASTIDTVSSDTELVTAGLGHQGETVLAWDSETPEIGRASRRERV